MQSQSRRQELRRRLESRAPSEDRYSRNTTLPTCDQRESGEQAEGEMGDPCLWMDSGHCFRKTSFFGQGVNDPGHTGCVCVDGSEYYEDRQNTGTDTTVNAEGVGQDCGEWGHTSSSYVSLSPNSRDGDREIQRADHDDTYNNTSVKVSLWVLELLSHIRHVLIPKVRPEDQCCSDPDRQNPVWEEGSEILDTNQWR